MGQDIRVFLVDDHEVAREGLRRMLELEPDIKIVGEAANAEETLLKVEPLSPDVVLMDIKMPGVNGLELTRQLKERGLAAEVVVLSLHAEYLAQAVEAGAGGYLVKDVKRAELVSAVRRAAQGEMVLGGSLMSTPEITKGALDYLHNVVRGRKAAASVGASRFPLNNPPAPANGDTPSHGYGQPQGSAGLRAPEPIYLPAPGIERTGDQAQDGLSGQPAIEWAELSRDPDSLPRPPADDGSVAAPSLEAGDAPDEPVAWAPSSSPDGSDLYGSDVELVIDPPVEANALLKLCQWLRGTAKADIQGTVGTWEGGTTMKIVLRRPLPLLEMLMSSPDVTKVWEEPFPGNSTGQGFFGRRKRERDFVDGPAKRLRLTIQSASTPKQLPLVFEVKASA